MQDVIAQKRKAVFLDRDGVLIQDCHLIRSFDQVRVFPGAVEVIAAFKDLGFSVFV